MSNIVRKRKKEMEKKEDYIKQVVLLGKVKDYLKENHLKGYNFCGGGTQVMKRLSGTYDGTIGTNTFWLPRNKVDMICLEHDLRYYYTTSFRIIKADFAMSSALTSLSNSKELSPSTATALNVAKESILSKAWYLMLKWGVVNGFKAFGVKKYLTWFARNIFLRTNMAQMFNDPNAVRPSEWATYAQNNPLLSMVQQYGRGRGLRGIRTGVVPAEAYNRHLPIYNQGGGGIIQSAWWLLQMMMKNVAGTGATTSLIGTLFKSGKDMMTTNPIDNDNLVNLYKAYLEQVGKFLPNGDFVIYKNIDHNKAKEFYETFKTALDKSVETSNKKQGRTDPIIPLENTDEIGFVKAVPNVPSNEILTEVEETKELADVNKPASSFKEGSVESWSEYLNTNEHLNLEFIDDFASYFRKEVKSNSTKTEEELKQVGGEDKEEFDKMDEIIGKQVELKDEDKKDEAESSSPPPEDIDDTTGKELAIRDEEKETPPPMEIGIDKVDDVPNGLVFPLPDNIVQGDELISSDDTAMVLYKSFAERAYDNLKKKWRYQNANVEDKREMLWTEMVRLRDAGYKRDAKALVKYKRAIGEERMYKAYQNATKTETSTQAPLQTTESTNLSTEAREVVDALQGADEDKEIEVVNRTPISILNQITNYFKRLYSGGTGDTTKSEIESGEQNTDDTKNNLDTDNIDMNQNQNYTKIPVQYDKEKDSSKKPVRDKDLTLKANAPTYRPMFPNITEENLDSLDILDSVEEHMRNLRNADIFDIPSDQNGGNGTAKTNDLIRMNEIQFNLSHAGKLSDERNAFNYPWDDAFYKPVPIIDEKEAVAELNTEDFLNNNNAILEYLEKYDRGDNGFMPSIQTKEEQKIKRNIYMPSSNYYEPTPYSKFDNTVNQGMLRTDFEKNVNYFLVP